MKRDLAKLAPAFAAIVGVAIIGLAMLAHEEAGPAPSLVATIEAGDGVGDRIDLGELHGEVVVLDFWAHWCPPCRRSIPKLNRLSREFAERGVRFYGVNTERRGGDTLRHRHNALAFGFPSFHDGDASLQDRFSVTHLPTLFVIDTEGNVRLRESGEADEDALRALLNELAPES